MKKFWSWFMVTFFIAVVLGMVYCLCKIEDIGQYRYFEYKVAFLLLAVLYIPSMIMFVVSINSITKDIKRLLKKITAKSILMFFIYAFMVFSGVSSGIYWSEKLSENEFKYIGKEFGKVLERHIVYPSCLPDTLYTRFIFKGDKIIFNGTTEYSYTKEWIK